MIRFTISLIGTVIVVLLFFGFVGWYASHPPSVALAIADGIKATVSFGVEILKGLL